METRRRVVAAPVQLCRGYVARSQLCSESKAQTDAGGFLSPVKHPSRAGVSKSWIAPSLHRSPCLSPGAGSGSVSVGPSESWEITNHHR